MKNVYLIGNAHIDPVWLWRWQEGYMEVKATFRSALDRMKRFEDFKFTSACAAYYEWIAETDPEMLAEIKERVREGRWCIAGGWYIQPDCNIPCGESFARHSLISQRIFKIMFGKIAVTGYNVDSFGHNGNLPQILTKSGMRNYVFMRPNEKEKNIPKNNFTWRSMDGSEIACFRIPISYAIRSGGIGAITSISDMAQSEDADHMAFYGIGNHGGGPTEDLLNRLHALGMDNLIFSTPDEFFENASRGETPIVDGDLQFHAKGCYSAYSKIKTDNRKCENNILAAERLCLLAKKILEGDSASASYTYPAREFEHAWKNILFNQFHDIMGGCSIKPAYEDASYLHGEAMSITEREINRAIQKISWNIDTLGEFEATDYQKHKSWKLTADDRLGTPVVIFNPLSWRVNALIRIAAEVKGAETESGEAIPCQSVRGYQTNGNDKYDTVFIAEVPALGYTVCRIFTDKENEFENPLSVSPCTLENSHIRVSFDEVSGNVRSFFDKASGRELLSGNCSAVVIDDSKNDTWAHGAYEFKDKLGEFEPVSMKVIESGPVRGTVRSVMRFGNSLLTRDYSITPSSPAVTVKTKVDFHTDYGILKIRIPVNVEKAHAISEIPYGYIERLTDGGENVCGKWFSVTDERKTYGMAVINDSKYSFDADGNTAGLTCLRNALFADHYGNRDELCEFSDSGLHEFTYAVFPFKSVADTSRRAYELNVPPRYIVESFHKGSLATRFEGISVSQENIILTAMKAADDGNGVILRFFETENRDTDVRIEIPTLKFSFDTRFFHNEIKTYRVFDGKITETDLLENSVQH